MQQTVIIADDAQFMRLMLKDILEEMGLTVVAEAADGRQAVSMYREHHPDQAILDITMPELDGVAAWREIRTTDPDACVVVISALGQKDEVLDAIRAGAGDFIIKPFEAERVEVTVRGLLTRQVQPA